LAEVISTNHENLKFYPSADDISSWKVLMMGPSDSEYENGIFSL